jgi:hypothetical protein
MDVLLMCRADAATEAPAGVACAGVRYGAVTAAASGWLVACSEGTKAAPGSSRPVWRAVASAATWVAQVPGCGAEAAGGGSDGSICLYAASASASRRSRGSLPTSAQPKPSSAQ